jgi:hypothetical protein
VAVAVAPGTVVGVRVAVGCTNDVGVAAGTGVEVKVAVGHGVAVAVAVGMGVGVEVAGGGAPEGPSRPSSSRQTVPVLVESAVMRTDNLVAAAGEEGSVRVN